MLHSIVPFLAQFRVIKDQILKRTKEVNINGLLGKLDGDFNNHYKNKLLDVATGKFDGCYSDRYKGISKKRSSGVGFKIPGRSSGVGFKIPGYEAQEKVIKNVVHLGNDMYKVPSFENNGISYVVHMDIGMIC